MKNKMFRFLFLTSIASVLFSFSMAAMSVETNCESINSSSVREKVGDVSGSSKDGDNGTIKEL